MKQTHKRILTATSTIFMVAGLLLTASEQKSLIPNICGVVLLGVGAFIYKKIN